MAAFTHIYVTAHGEYATGSWIGENAQIGLRLPMAEGADEPAKGSVFTPIANGDVVSDTGTQAGVNGTLTRTWAGRIGPIASTDNADAAMQADLGDDVWTFLNTIKAYTSNQFRWTHVKIAPILADGKYGAPSATYQFTTPLQGTGTGNMLPPEVACAVTLRAPVLGRRGRGRFYLPALPITPTVDTSGTVLAAARTALLAATATLITNLQDMPGTEDYGPIVAVMSASSATAVRPSEIRVGNHFDAQRRRQHQITEVYSTTVL